jgi:anthranilate phosphoribosyltransferase
MDAQRFITEIGRGAQGARSLPYDMARQMFELLFEGRFDDIELGAILIALRMKGESLDEVRAALDVLEPGLNRLPVDVSRPCVSIPSYNGARHTPNLVPLLACLLADAGVQVVVHGVSGDERRTSTAEIMSAMSSTGACLPSCRSSCCRRHWPVCLPYAPVSAFATSATPWSN